jgi:hypothetical protein
MTAVELLPLIREAYSRRPDWIPYPAERLARTLYIWGYAWELPEVFEVEAALAVLDIERKAA